MYLDTKNLAATPQTGSSLDITATSSPSSTATTPLIPAPAKAKSSKLRKVWKRLTNMKGGTTTASTSSSSSATPPAHPNNVSLNNQAMPCTLSPPPTAACAHPPKDLSVDLATRTLEKLTLCSTDSPAGRCSFEELQAVISSASIEKTPIVSACMGCAHGRNCTRHTALGEDSAVEQQYRDELCLQQEMLQLQAEAQALIHYLSTDDGTFIWPSGDLQRIDDDLLHEWLCQSYRQFPDAMTALRC